MRALGLVGPKGPLNQRHWTQAQNIISLIARHPPEGWGIQLETSPLCLVIVTIPPRIDLALRPPAIPERTSASS